MDKYYLQASQLSQHGAEVAMDNAVRIRSEFIEAHEPPLSEADQAAADEIDRICLSAIDAYFATKGQHNQP